MLIRQDVDVVKIKIKELILFLIRLIELKPPSFTKEGGEEGDLCIKARASLSIYVLDAG